MSFTNPIIGGGNALIREEIKSPDYVAGISGWRIGKDGTAEFNDVVLRGELFVTDPDGSYVRVYDQNPGSGALIEFGLPTASGAVLTPASITSSANASGTGHPGIVFKSATVDGSPFAILNMISNTTTDISEVFLDATDIIISAENFGRFYAGSILDFQMLPGGSGLFRVRDGDATFEQDLNVDGSETVGGSLTVDGNIFVNGSTIVVNNKSTLNTAQGAGTTTSATYVDLPAPSSLSFTKKYNASTKLIVTVCAGARSNAALTTVRFGVRINGVDTDVAHMEIPDANKHVALSGVTTVTGLLAGTYTVQVRYRRTAGAGTLQVDSNDWLSLAVEEVPV